MRLVVDFKIQVATMPLGDLAFLFDATLTDMGSRYAPKDEVTETIHNLYERVVVRYRSDRARVKGVFRAS